MKKGNGCIFLNVKNVVVLSAILTNVIYAGDKIIDVDNLQIAKKQCAIIAEDINGGTVTLKVDANFYEKHRVDFQENIPDKEFCSFIESKKEGGYYKVVYGSAFGDTDASDLNEKAIAEANQAMKKAKAKYEKAKQKMAEANQAVKKLALLTKEEQLKEGGAKFSTILADILQKIEKKNITKSSILEGLNQMQGIIDSLKNVGKIGDKNLRKTRIEGLKLLITIYGKDSEIGKKSNEIIKQLKS